MGTANMNRCHLSNGDTLTVTDTGTIDPAAAARPLTLIVAQQAADLLDSGNLIGPQVDEFTGIRGERSDPDARLAALVSAARDNGLAVVLYE